MSRMKTFFNYLILFLLFYLFVSIMSYLFVRSTLTEMENIGIEFKNPQITIEEAKSSKVNALVKGKIISDNTQQIQYKYIKIDFISDRGNVISSRFIDISDIASGGEKDFIIRTNSDNIEKYKITLTDEKNINDIDISKSEITNVLLGLLLAWMVIN